MINEKLARFYLRVSHFFLVIGMFFTDCADKQIKRMKAKSAGDARWLKE